jgi:DNA-binding response OmpR family regulator
LIRCRARPADPALALQLKLDMRATVMVVDDEAPLLRAMQRLLGKTFDVICADCARTAVSSYSSGLAAVLTDFSMPDGDGLQLARELRAKGYQGVIAILSAVVETDELKAALASGEVDELISKPWSSAQLVARVTALCHRRAPVGADPVGVQSPAA